jgi:hypothetical protein
MHVRRFVSALSFCIGAALLAACGSQAGGGSGLVPPASGASKSLPYHKTYNYAGREQWFTVPAGVKKLTVIAVGARGAGPTEALGGRVWAIVPVTPGEKLAVFVGGQGSASRGGFNGGGDGGAAASYGYGDGYGAGGASDVRQGGDGLSDRIVVAGAGGGAGESYFSNSGGGGGNGGDSTAEAGGAGAGNGAGGGGGGGTQHSGGAGGPGGEGSSSSPGGSGDAGLFGAGGDGGAASGFYGAGSGGGGGGGGYYGGGGGGSGSSYYYGGAAGGGGGGGSSYIEPSAYAYHSWQGWRIKTCNGLVVFDW